MENQTNQKDKNKKVELLKTKLSDRKQNKMEKENVSFIEKTY